MWQTLFILTNAIAVTAWLALLFAPRRPLTLSAVLYAGIALLCLIYAAILVALLAGWVDPGRSPGAGSASLTDYSVAGLRALLARDGGIILAWTHVLAFDLFAGLWIARDGDAKRIGRLVQAPILVTTFMVGPLGLLAWLAVREPAARRSSKTGSAR